MAAQVHSIPHGAWSCTLRLIMEVHGPLPLQSSIDCVYDVMV